MLQVPSRSVTLSEIEPYLHPLSELPVRNCFRVVFGIPFFADYSRVTLTDKGFRAEIVKVMKMKKEELIDQSKNNRIFQKGVKLFKRVLNEFNDLSSSNEYQRDDTLKAVFARWRREYLQSQGVTFIKDSFPCKKEHFLGETPRIVRRSITFIVCSDYALLQLGEKRALSFFLSDACADMNCLSIIEEWGYERVKGPEPGDLVIYGNVEEGFFNVLHYGVWNDKGKVISKWGCFDVFEHPLDYVDYGGSALFYRKHIFKEVLNTLQQDLQNDSITTVEQFNLHFSEVVQQKLNSCHIHSLAYRFFETWLQTFPAKVSEVVQDNNLTQLSSLLEESARSIPLQFDRPSAQ